MKRLILLAVLCLCASASATTYGKGSDIPTNITVNGISMPQSGTPTAVPSYSGGFNSEPVCWDTTLSSDSLLEIDYYGSGYSAPTAHRKFYNAAMVTHHCITADYLLPGRTYLANVASCSTGPNCSRFDSHWSIAPTGNSQSNGVQFIMPSTNPAHTLSWEFLPIGPYVSDGVDQSKAFNVDLIGLWQDGPAPAYIMVTAMAVDGHACTAAKPAASCPGSHTSLVFDSVGSSGGEVISPTTNNYSVLIISGGTYNGDFAMGGSTAAIKNGIFNQPGDVMRVITDGSTTIGSHTITATFQATDASKVAMGSPVLITYNFTVQAQTTFPYPGTRPTSFPSISSLAKWNTTLASNAPAKFNLVQTDNLTLGEYNNDNMGAIATAFDPYAIMNYSGERVAFQISDYLGAVTTHWQSSHSYSLGDAICTSEPTHNCATSPDFVQIVTTAGTSAGSAPSWNTTPGNITAESGTLRWTNAGDVAYWNSMAQRVLMQTMNWELLMPRSTSWQEWNNFPVGTEMDYFREGGAQSENCNGGGSCNGLQAKALAYLASPLIATTGITTQRIIYDYKYTPPATVRSLPYSTETLLLNWLVRGAPVVNGGVDEVQARIDLQLQTLNEIRHCNPVDSGTGPKCVLATPSFDLGLIFEDLIHAYTVEAYEHTLGGPAPDARIPVAVKAAADWLYSNEYNLTGTDHALPYTLWFTPVQIGTSYTSLPGLDNLVAPAYAWLGAMYGDTCTLPTSGAACFTVADDMFSHTLDVPFTSAKQLNQAFKWWYDFLGWRQGWMTGEQSIILPTFNPNNGTLPDKMEPFNLGDFPHWSDGTHNPRATSITAHTATIQWYTPEATTATQVRFGTSFGSLGTPTICGAGTFVGGYDALWLNSCAISGLPSATNLIFGVGATDAAGNVAFSAQNPDQGGTYFNFTTLAGGTLVFVGPSSCPNGYQSTAYAGCTTTASGGVLPYTWSISAGSLPTGLTQNTSTGAITGTPSAHGTYSFTVTVTDSTGGTPLTASKGYSVTIYYPVLSITTASCPGGTVGTSYAGCTQTYSGGNASNTWSVISGALPFGLSMNASTGAITGTPTTTGGLFTFTTQVADSESPAQIAKLVQTINVAASGSLVITTSSCPGGTQGVSYTCTMAATGGTAPYTWSVPLGFGSCPPGISPIVPSTGVITGTPTTGGYCILGTSVHDSAGTPNVAAQIVTIAIAWPALAMTTPACPGGTVGVAYSCSLAATGGDGNYTWSISSGSLPAGVALDPSSGNIFGIPTIPGSYSAAALVTDSELPTHHTDTGTVAVAIDIGGMTPNSVMNNARANNVIVH